MRKISKIILHCAATPEGRDVSTETIRQWHLDRGWSDIGYHYVIELDGSINPGRPVERIGAHVRNFNRNSIGICYVGGLSSNMSPKDTRNESQLESLELLIEKLMIEYPESTLHGHNEFSSKACPSFDVQKEYKYIIDCYA